MPGFRIAASNWPCTPLQDRNNLIRRGRRHRLSLQKGQVVSFKFAQVNNQTAWYDLNSYLRSQGTNCTSYCSIWPAGHVWLQYRLMVGWGSGSPVSSNSDGTDQPRFMLRPCAARLHYLGQVAGQRFGFRTARATMPDSRSGPGLRLAALRFLLPTASRQVGQHHDGAGSRPGKNDERNCIPGAAIGNEPRSCSG